MKAKRTKQSRFLDITGNRYWKLTVLGFSHRTDDYRYMWSCLCECGNVTVVDGGDLKSGHTQSCGCYRTQRQIESNIKHGKSSHRLYNIWGGIRTRVFNKNDVGYPNYGGRGIEFSEDWTAFINFYNWAIENGYRDNLTIERIDVNGNYEPSNCRWIPLKEQSRNRRGVIVYGGETIPEASKRLGIDMSALHCRIKSGKSLEEAFNTKKYVRIQSK